MVSVEMLSNHVRVYGRKKEKNVHDEGVFFLFCFVLFVSCPGFCCDSNILPFTAPGQWCFRFVSTETATFHVIIDDAVTTAIHVGLVTFAAF